MSGLSKLEIVLSFRYMTIKKAELRMWSVVEGIAALLSLARAREGRISILFVAGRMGVGD